MTFTKNFKKPAQVQILMNTMVILMQKYGSIFQARHIARLERDPLPPDTLLLHIDLQGVVKRLGHEAATQRDRTRIDKRITTPTPCS